MSKYVLQVVSVAVIFLQSYSLENSPVISISHGKIRGSIIRTFDQQIPYQAFIGIPYAKPPVGDLRFKEPRFPNKWKGIYNATDEREICMQPITTVYGTTEVKGSEDCLYLNVYTPVLANHTHKHLPVMFYIHGGAFIDGSKIFEEYGPDFFIDDGVIMIFIQYRLGVYGFLSTQDDACPGNNGLKDQVLALKWTKENVKYFGGDPDKVTIFGQSAGSSCIGYLLESPMSKGLFRAAIMQSGSMINSFATATHPAEKAFELGRKFEIFTNNSRELITKLRSIKNNKSLYNTANTVASKFDDSDITYTNYGPTIEHDHPNAFLTKKPLQLLNDKKIHGVPVIIGHTTLEAQFFTALVASVTTDISNNITHLVPNTLIPADDTTDQLIADRIKDYYFKNTTGGFHEFDVQRYVSDNLFVRGILKTSRLLSRATKVYQYTFGYIGNLRMAKQGRKGVGHTEELNYMFHKLTENQNISKADTAVRYELVRWWTNFAKTLNPTPGNTGLIWPVLDQRTGFKSLLINKTNIIRERESEENIIFWDNLFKYDTGHVGWY